MAPTSIMAQHLSSPTFTFSGLSPPAPPTSHANSSPQGQHQTQAQAENAGLDDLAAALAGHTSNFLLLLLNKMLHYPYSDVFNFTSASLQQLLSRETQARITSKYFAVGHLCKPQSVLLPVI